LITPASERRQYPRLKKNVPVKLCSGDFDVVTETYNVSCNGAYCRVDKYLEPMTKLKIHLLLSIKKGNRTLTKKISCQGVVVRTESQPDNTHFNIAIYFNEIAKKDSQYLADYVQTVLAADAS